MNIIRKVKDLGWWGLYTTAKYATCISPKLNTRILYHVTFGKKWDENNPVTINDKVLWLKYHTYWKNGTVKKCADKFLVRQWLLDNGFGEYLNDLICCYESPEEICLKDLPNQFAMKLNVGCRCNLVCKDKNELDEEQVIETARKWFKQDYYKRFAEMQYKDVKPCIIVEKYLGTESGELPVDYKFYCMNGKASSVMVCVDRKDGQHPKFFFLDREWNKLPYTEERFLYPDLVIEKPKMIDQAFDLAEKLSKNFPFVRVDLYIIGEKIYFGELTFTPAAGLDSDFKFVPPGGKEDADTTLGKLLTLPKN